MNDCKKSNTSIDRQSAAWPLTWIVCIAIALACANGSCGCASINLDDERIQAAFDRAVAAIEMAVEEGKTIPADAPSADAPAAGNPAGEQSSPATDAVPYSELNWSMGGFRGVGALQHSGAVIGSLKISSSGMSYRWVRGGCETLGASSAGDSSHTLACLFYRDASGRWQGGKFDWISTSRISRDFKNIDSGYNGWDPSAFHASKEFAFVIVGTGGRRSNVIRVAK